MFVFKRHVCCFRSRTQVFSQKVFSGFKMSRLIFVVGDSNVRRNMTGLNIASRDAMKTAQMIDCTNMASLDAALSAVRAESTICIVAVVTELLLATGECGTIFSTIDPILATFAQKLNDFCSSRLRAS